MYRTIVEESKQNVAIMDVFSKLVQQRIIFIDGPINDDLANAVIAQMLYLSSIDPAKQIDIYINSPGGSIVSGLAIYDVSQLIKTPIRTVCIGEASSMAAILMVMGVERCGLKHSRFMLHQASGGAIGSTEDLKTQLKEVELLQNSLYEIIKEKTNLKEIDEWLKFDRYFSSEEALEYGLITKILN